MTTTWGSVVRATAKKYGWRSVRGDWYVIRDEFFYSARITIVKSAMTGAEGVTMSTAAKPLMLDAIRWDAYGTAEADRKDSARFVGGILLPGVAMDGGALTTQPLSPDDLTAAADSLATRFAADIERFHDEVPTPEAFADRLLASPARDRYSNRATWQQSIAMNMAFGNLDEAERDIRQMLDEHPDYIDMRGRGHRTDLDVELAWIMKNRPRKRGLWPFRR